MYMCFIKELENYKAIQENPQNDCKMRVLEWRVKN